MSEPDCNGCRACCQKQLVAIMPEDEPNAAHYDAVDIGGGFRALRNLPNGDCAHLTPTGCGIYEVRPTICRVYDCRMQFKVMSRNSRRQWSNQEIWREARKRLHTLTPSDLATLDAYRFSATRGETQALAAQLEKVEK